MDYEEELANKVIGCSIEVHRHLGPGLLASTYRECLRFELASAGLKAEAEKSMAIRYKQLSINNAYRVDMLVDDTLILEIKSVEVLNAVHSSQLLTYLRHSDLRLGLLINFNVTLLKNGIKRVIN